MLGKTEGLQKKSQKMLSKTLRNVKCEYSSLICCLIQLMFVGGTLASVVISFLFNMGYLLIGYWYTESEGYDICWTMPHCVLCLRLIGKNNIEHDWLVVQLANLRLFSLLTHE